MTGVLCTVYGAQVYFHEAPPHVFKYCMPLIRNGVASRGRSMYQRRPTRPRTYRSRPTRTPRLAIFQ